MKIQIIDTLQGLLDIEVSWNKLAELCDTLSLYSSYDYNRIAWKHFSSPSDKLFVLALYDGAVIRAIAPFCITRKKIRLIPVRTIEFIANWEGDKPSIIAPGCEDAAWGAIFAFFSSAFREWDVIKIMEQPNESTFLEGCLFLHDRKHFCQVSHDSLSYYTDLSETWESYFDTRSVQQKKNWRRRQKKLDPIKGGISVETVVCPDRVSEALSRFETLEKMSWKGTTRIGIHGSSSLRLFYEDFSRLLAEKGQVFFHFLQIAGCDAAGMISFLYRDIIYSRHITYNPEYARYSPGIYLEVHQLRLLFGKGLRKYDMMGMHPAQGAPMDKVERATGMQKTVQLLVLKNRVKLIPEIVWRRIKARLTHQQLLPAGIDRSAPISDPVRGRLVAK